MSTSPQQLPVLPVPNASQLDAAWLRAARQARWLAWLRLLWMTLEGLGARWRRC
jgi:hypothetical protein